MNSIPDRRAVGRGMTVVTILSWPGCINVIGQRSGMGVCPVQRKITTKHIMTDRTDTIRADGEQGGVTTVESTIDTARICSGMQAAVINSINMAVLAVVIMDSANNIGRAVTACTLVCPCRQEPRGMGIT